MTSPCDLTATEARALIGAKRLSPVELTESCIARAEAVDHAINAFAARDFDRALKTARQQEEAVMGGEPLGVLHGLPLGVKDMVETAGLRTTYGSLAYKDNVPENDERLTAVLREAGANVLAKTNNPEWSAGANTRNAVYGATGNPFDPSRSAAGSSGGSAAALACGMVPIATGSDTGGSLRNPAAYCGVVGFRPTPGLIPSERRGMAWLQLATLGPMARTVADAGLLLSVMMGEDSRDPLSGIAAGEMPEDYATPATLDLSSLRVALTPDFGFTPTESIVRDAFGEKTGLFRSAFAVADDTHPDCEGADEAFEVLRAVGFLGPHRRLLEENPELVGPNVRANVEEGLTYSAADVARGLELQTAMYRRWQGFFEEYDIILSPAVTVSPRSWRELYPKEIDGQPTRTYFHWLALAYASTLPGHPSLSLPVGVDSQGMPFGLQIVGRRGGDAEVLAVAAALEAHLAGDARTARPAPDLAALEAAPALSTYEGFMSFD
ncbi:amidase [Kaustia mangrovi]|uniref:Amidase n=1 Tax=Kaustia mangrovi TaxID=2593653 RepID=A0A7S8C3Q5_9HYPH|nr:amidase family protein [Kaustia mangrovi]QPC42797.1 amidase [Kaustia mangrovi]